MRCRRHSGQRQPRTGADLGSSFPIRGEQLGSRRSCNTAGPCRRWPRLEPEAAIAVAVKHSNIMGMMIKDNSYSGVVGAPELTAQPGRSSLVRHSLMSFHPESDFGTLPLSTPRGVLLALDWVVGKTHQIWGSSVMVAPGVALTARHTVDAMRERGFLNSDGGQLRAYGFEQDKSLTIWATKRFTTVGDGDLSILTLVRATAGVAPNATLQLPVLAARQPKLKEKIVMIGYAATHETIEDFARDGVGVDLRGSLGKVIDVYPERRDRFSLPNPSIGIAARVDGGMSGGAAFDESGRLIGIISRGDETSSFVSLLWPSVFTPIDLAWPPVPIEGRITLASLTSIGWAKIDNLEYLSEAVDEDGMPHVGLSVMADQEPDP